VKQDICGAPTDTQRNKRTDPNINYHQSAMRLLNNAVI
jgi:hypothetical protein